MSSALQPELSTSEHCYFAFSVLDSHLSGGAAPEPGFRNVNTALFVTWNKVGSSGEHRLRGCIGTLSPRWVHQGLKDYALTSALRDGRFQPITARELPSLTVKVSLISCFEEASSWQDWEVGRHGIQIEFQDPSLGVTRSATYLPEVAPEQGWDVVEAIRSLIRKAGFNGHISETLLNSIRLVRYQSSVTGMTYSEYTAMKKQRQPQALEGEHAQAGCVMAVA